MPSPSLQSVGYDAVLWHGERRGMARQRADLLSDCHGRVLQIGGGAGLNRAHYPSTVTHLLLTEPDPGMAARLCHRAERSELSTAVLVADAQALPVPDASVDVVVSTLVLCTVPDARGAVAEERLHDLIGHGGPDDMGGPSPAEVADMMRPSSQGKGIRLLAGRTGEEGGTFDPRPNGQPRGSSQSSYH